MNILFLTTKSFSKVENGASIRTNAIYEAIEDNISKVIYCENDIPSVFNFLPISYRKYYSNRLKNRILDTIKRNKINLIVADHMQTAPLIYDIQIPKILHLHNLESVLISSISKYFKKDFMISNILKFESYLIKNLERKIFKTFDNIIFPTYDEISFINNDINYSIIENCSSKYCDSFIWKEDNNVNYSTLTNPIWFINRLSLKKIIKLSSKVKGNFIKPVYTKNIIDRLKSLSILVSFGNNIGGSKIKIITGLVTGIPQVISKNDSFGLNISEGQGVLIANNEKDWINKTNILLSNKELQITLSKKAKSFSIKEKYSFSETVKKYKTLFKEYL